MNHGLAPAPALSARDEWRRSWTVVLAASAGFSFMSFMSPVMGLFMEPLQREFGWTRAFLSSGPAVGAVLSLLLAPVFGALIDRYGSRRMALPGLVTSSLAIAGFSLLTGAAWQWLALWFVFSLLSQTIHATTWTAAVTSVFSSGRGLALGLTLSGSAVALAIVPPLSQWLIAGFGWRSAFVALGLGWGGVALLLCWFFLFDARDYQRKARQGQTSADAPPPALTGLTIAEAWRNSALWRVAIATVLILTITVGVQVHQVPILVDVGVSRVNAAWLASLGGIAGVIGKVVTGLLIDRYHVRWVGGLTLASTAVAYPLLLEPFRTPALITVAIVINGYAAGTKMQLCSYLTARYGGMRNYGKIYGVMASMIAVAGGAGPILAGACFDRLGSYAAFLIIGAAISVISGALVFSLGRYPRWET